MKYVLITFDDTTLKDPDTGEPMDLYAYLFNELDNQQIPVHMLEFSTPEDLVERFQADAQAAGVTIDQEVNNASQS